MKLVEYLTHFLVTNQRNPRILIPDRIMYWLATAIRHIPSAISTTCRGMKSKMLTLQRVTSTLLEERNRREKGVDKGLKGSRVQRREAGVFGRARGAWTKMRDMHLAKVIPGETKEEGKGPRFHAATPAAVAARGDATE